MAIAEDVVSTFVDPLETFIADGASNLAGALEGPLVAGSMLYIVIFGIMVLLGYVRLPISDFVVNVLKISVIVALVTQIDNYTFFVTDLFFVQLPEGLSSAIGNVNGDAPSGGDLSSGSAFDTIMNRVIIMGEEISNQASWNDFYPYIVAAFYTAIGLLVTMVLLAIYLFSKVALALILVLGPIFIAMLLFRVTQPFFSSWLAAAANFVVLQVLAVALITLMLSIISSYLDDSSGESYASQMLLAWRLAGLFALTLYLGLNLPDIAARISGGGLALGGGIASSALQAMTKIPGMGAAARVARGGGSMTRG